MTRRQHMLFPHETPNDIVKGSPFIFMRWAVIYSWLTHSQQMDIFSVWRLKERGSEGRDAKRAGGELRLKERGLSLPLCPCVVVTGQIWLLISSHWGKPASYSALEDCNVCTHSKSYKQPVRVILSYLRQHAPCPIQPPHVATVHHFFINNILGHLFFVMAAAKGRCPRPYGNGSSE